MQKSLLNAAIAVLMMVLIPIGNSAAQEVKPYIDYSGTGKNFSFSLMEADPDFFGTKYEVLRTRQKDAYIRCVITDDHDEYMMMVLINNDDIVEFLEMLSMRSAKSEG